MNARTQTISRRATVLALAAIAVVALGGTALAGHIGSDVKSYTGCLVSNDGVIVKVKEGDTPKSACSGGQTLVHLSGGDITAVRTPAGNGLTGGSENGAMTLGLSATQKLPSCAQGNVPGWNGSAWACYRVGTGLAADIADNNWQIAESYRLPQSCTNGQVAKSNGAGVWNCESDNDTTYSAGTGLGLSGTQFSIASDYRVKNTPDCASGQFTTGFDGNGTIQCAAPTAPSLQTFQARQANFQFGDGVPDDDAYHTYITLPVPAGTYLLIGKGVLRQGTDDFSSGGQDQGLFCRIGNLPNEFAEFNASDDEFKEHPFALTGVVATSGEALTLQCRAKDDADDVAVQNATLVALKVG